MSVAARTIAETTDDIRAALQEYIEATYHIGDVALVMQRRHLLEQEGVIFRSPYIESTPRYVSGRLFGDLELPEAAKSLLDTLTTGTAGKGPLLNDPPYAHQAAALELSCRDGLSF